MFEEAILGNFTVMGYGMDNDRLIHRFIVEEYAIHVSIQSSHFHLNFTLSPFSPTPSQITSILITEDNSRDYSSLLWRRLYFLSTRDTHGMDSVGSGAYLDNARSYSQERTAHWERSTKSILVFCCR